MCDFGNFDSYFWRCNSCELKSHQYFRYPVSITTYSLVDILENKIDKENANIERTKNTLLENGIYLEGMGGTIPFVAISAKQGRGSEGFEGVRAVCEKVENRMIFKITF